MFSIIIPTYNRLPILSRSLQNVFAMRGIEQCEILVVSDGSTDGTDDFLKHEAARRDNLQPLFQKNSGPGEARNLGIRHASRSRILFLDDDIFPEPNLLYAHKEALDTVCDVSQGNIVWHDELRDDELIQFMDANGMQFRFDQYTDKDPISYEHIYTANLALPTKAVHAVGGFDSVFAEKRYAFEDTAFAWRLHNENYRIAFTSDALATHLHPLTEEQLVRREYTVGYGMAVLNAKYPQIAQDLNFAKIRAGAEVKLLLIKALLMSRVGYTLGTDFVRKLAVHRALLEGMLDGSRAC